MVSKSSSLIVEDTSAPAGPYARTANAAQHGEFSDLFIEEDDIYIFKQLVGQSKRFLYMHVDDKPENYERPSGFDEGDFQQMTLSKQEITDGIHKQFKISLCKHISEEAYQIRKHGECGKKWTLQKYYFVFDDPIPDTHLVYVGSRDTKVTIR